MAIFVRNASQARDGEMRRIECDTPQQSVPVGTDNRFRCGNHN